MSLIVTLPVPNEDYRRRSAVPVGDLSCEDSCLMSSTRKQIVPVACIDPKGYNRFFQHNQSEIKDLLSTDKNWANILDPDFPEGIQMEILKTLYTWRDPTADKSSYYHRDGLMNIEDAKRQRKQVNALLLQVKENLTRYATGPLRYEVFDNQTNANAYYWRYQSLIDHFWIGSGFRILRTRNPRMRFVVGRYYLAHYNSQTGATIPLVCLVTQAKFIDMIRWSHLLAKPVDSKYFKLWVKDDFDVVRSEYKLIRPRYRKFIKKPLEEEAGIQVVTKPDLKILFSKFQGVKCDTMKEYQEFLIDSSKEILFELRQREGLLSEEEISEIKA